MPAVKGRRQLVDAPVTEIETLLVTSRLVLFDEITAQMKALESRLEKLAAEDERARLLMTHPGIGVINALALVHTLGEVRRFRRKEEVVAFVGLDPLEKSSGQTKRIGQISKHGSRLARHLLGQAAQACRDRRIRKFYLEVSRRRGRPKQRLQRHGSYSSTATSCFVTVSVTRSSSGGAKLACARGQERRERKPRSLEA